MQRLSRLWMFLGGLAIISSVLMMSYMQRADKTRQAAALEIFDQDFIKSPNEQRQHYSFFLPNGLQVLLISDNRTLKSAASMHINIGSGSDPAHRQGLAHYLEHMLFLGTQNYPTADQFQSFIREHGGDYNAYTAYDHTNYFFDIKNDHFEDALARFADFFIAPLFNAEFAERERNVVDSEFHLGLKQDARIYYAMLKQALNPQHPLTGFHIGNGETLSGNASQLRQDLRDFWQRHYLAKTMKLTLYSPQSIDAMRDLAQPLFSALSDEEHSDPLPQKPFFAADSLPALLQFRPVKESRSVDYYFSIPPQRKHYRSKPEYYVARLLEARHKNSLYDVLNKRGWIKYIDSGSIQSLPESALFVIHITLTPAGEQHLKEITALVLQTARMLRQEDRSKAIEKWRFDELSQARALSFRYKAMEDPLPYVRSLSRRLQLLPTPDILSSNLMHDYQPQQILAILEALRLENMLMVYVSPAAKGDQIEKYYGVEYGLRKLTPSEAAQYAAIPTDKIELAGPNPFLRDHNKIKLLAASQAKEGPDVLPLQLPLDRINAYYKFDASFKTPRAEMRMILRPVLAERHSPLHLSAQRVMVEMIEEQLEAVDYMAELGGYDYSLSSGYSGLSLHIHGYAKGLKLWAENVLQEMLNVNYEPALLERVKESIRQDLNNRRLGSPLEIAHREMDRRLLSYKHNEELLLEALETITPETLRQFTQNYFAQLRIMALVHGNLPQQEATDILNASLALFGEVSPLPLAETSEELLRVYQAGRLSATGKSQHHTDSAVKLYYQGKQEDYADRAKIALLASILQPIFFQQLRTEQELGYIVSLYYQRMHRIPGISMIVQSNRQDADELTRRVDRFLVESVNFLTQLAAQDFENYKQGLINRLREPPLSLGEAGGRFFSHIKIKKLDFDEPERVIAALENITQSELVEYHKRWLTPANSYVFKVDPAKKPKRN